MSRHSLTLNLSDELAQRLQRAAEAASQSPATFAAVLLDETLRMQSHPDILFRDGPAGRRPALTYGPDVWEVARVLRELDWTKPEDRARAEYLTGLTARWLDAAQKYYAAYADEIDAWIERVDREADAALAASSGRSA